MKLALEEAKIALDNGDYPVGAVLVIDGEVVGKKRNHSRSIGNRAMHAELSLIKENSDKIVEKTRNGSKAELYVTLEPCLMCLGAAALHNISRIVFACPDPHGGATKLNSNTLSDWYVRHWPKIKGGLLKEESHELLIKFMKSKNTETWNRILSLFEQMRKNW